MKKYDLINKNSLKIILGIIVIIIFFTTVFVFFRNRNIKTKTITNKLDNSVSFSEEVDVEKYNEAVAIKNKYYDDMEEEMKQEDVFLPPTTTNEDLVTILKEIFDLIHNNKDEILKGHLEIHNDSVEWSFVPRYIGIHDTHALDALFSYRLILFKRKLIPLIEEVMIKNKFIKNYSISSDYFIRGEVAYYYFYKKNNLGCFLRVENEGSSANTILVDCYENYFKMIDQYKKTGIRLYWH